MTSYTFHVSLWRNSVFDATANWYTQQNTRIKKYVVKKSIEVSDLLEFFRYKLYEV